MEVTPVEGEVINTAKHGHLVEFGHAIKGGGSVPAHSFVRAGFDAQKEAAESRVREGIRRLINEGL